MTADCTPVERAAEVVENLDGDGLLIEPNDGDPYVRSDVIAEAIIAAGFRWVDADTERKAKLGAAFEALARRHPELLAAIEPTTYDLGWSSCLDAIYREAGVTAAAEGDSYAGSIRQMQDPYRAAAAARAAADRSPT